MTYKILYAKKINVLLDLEKYFGMKFFHYAPGLRIFLYKKFLTMPLDLGKNFRFTFFSSKFFLERNVFPMPLDLEKNFESIFSTMLLDLDHASGLRKFF